MLLAKGKIASLSGAGDDPRHFQISAPAPPGNSGGALVESGATSSAIVSAKGLADGHQLNCAVKGRRLWSFRESAPAVSARLKAPVTADRKFEEGVKSARDAAGRVLVC